MKHSRFQRILTLFTSAAIAVGTLSLTAFAEEGDKVIKVFHTNDVHSRYESTIAEDGTLENFGYARLKTLINQNVKVGESALVFDAGDVFHGQPFATMDEGSSIAKLMRAVGYDAVTPGNHDFNYGSARLPQLAQLAHEDLLAANVKRSNNRVPDGFKEYEIFEEQGVKIGVFGLSTPETSYKTNPKNVQFYTFQDPVATAERMVDVLRNQEKVDVVICLSHLGIDEASAGNRSTDVAQKVSGIDLIIDGHSHSTPDQYTQIGDTVITSAGEYMQYVGMATITVDQAGDVSVETSTFKASDYQATDLPVDVQVQSTIDEIKAAQEITLNQVVTTTPITLEGEREMVRTQETNLSRLLTSAMLDETGADVAITNGGGIRTSIEKGSVTVGDVQAVLPFGNYIVTVKLTGAQLKEAVENGLPGRTADGLEVLGKMAQVAGLEITYDPSQPQGSRIVSITHDGQPVEDGQVYTVATNDFMQSGGDEYTSLKQPIENEFGALDEALIDYLTKIGSVGINANEQEQRVTAIG